MIRMIRGSFSGKVEDGLGRERLEASLGGGSHPSLGKLTTRTSAENEKDTGADSPGPDSR